MLGIYIAGTSTETTTRICAANFCIWAKFKELEDCQKSITEKENPDPRDVERAFPSSYALRLPYGLNEQR